jgi:sarcosine oxidase, subunit beta
MECAAKYVIVGGGLQGLAIAWTLASRGETDVITLERGALCSGMTGKSSGIIRCHYGTPSLAAMSWYGVDFFTNATDIVGDDLAYRQCGYVVGVGENNLDALKANVGMQQALGIDVELIDHDKMAELWPGLRLDDFAAFAYEPRAGRGEAYLTGMAFASAARKLGVRIQQYTSVDSLLQNRTGAVNGVRLAGGAELHAEHIILATGAWAPTLGATIGLDIPVKTQRAQLAVVDPGEPASGLPALSDLVSLQYLCSEPNGDLLVGNSDHADPEYIDPDRYSNRADERTVEKYVGRLSHRLPDMADPRIKSTYAGGYDVTPDYNPIIGPAPVEGLFLAVGFSGHGFKISPAVGRLVADLLIDGNCSLQNVEASDFRHDRFAEGDLLVSQHPYQGAEEMR